MTGLFENMQSSAGGGITSYFTTQNIGIILLVLLIIAIIFYIFIWPFLARKMEPEYKENSERIPRDEQASKDAELMLFYVDWCPHCKTAKPEWEQVKAEYEGKNVNGYNMVFTEVNCTSESPDVEKMMNQFKIEGYPTIKLVKDGQVIEYDAKPSKDTIIQFIDTVVV